MTVTAIEIPNDAIAEFCERWNITEFAGFGSVLREDFNADSDIDVLATFASTSCWTLLDEAQMELDFEVLFGRKVDLVSRSAIEHSPNWIRRNRILSAAVAVYAKAASTSKVYLVSCGAGILPAQARMPAPQPVKLIH